MSILAGTSTLLFAVDDQQDNVDLVVRSLGKSYNVQGFTDPRKALEAATQTPPVGLVVDYRMPGMNGVELLRALRQTGHKCAAVMLTAFPELDEVVYAQQTKLIYRVVPKPCSAEDLRTEVELAIATVLYMGALDTYRRLSRT
jgi:CheY-like chemotaxis protein